MSGNAEDEKTQEIFCIKENKNNIEAVQQTACRAA